MNICLDSELVKNLIDECENIRRREASDVEDEDFEKKELPYIDTNSYVDTVSSDNNTLILGRRGCGKTSLLLKVSKVNLQSENPKLIIIKDMQSLKKNDYDIVICKLLLLMLNKMGEYICNNIWHDIDVLYKKNYKSIGGLIKRIIRKQDESIKERYNNTKALLFLIETMKENVIQIGKLEKTIKYRVVLSHEKTNTRKQSAQVKVSGEIFASNSINFEYLKGMGVTENDFKIGIDIANIVSEDATENNEEVISREDEIVKHRADILEEQKEKVIILLRLFYEITKKKVVYMLDDFYQLQGNKQPQIIQFFHDISKECSNRCFRFKLFAIPGRLRLNEKGVDMSYKDDFSPVTIDTDVSDIEFLIKHLSSMLSEISKSLNATAYLSANDILDLFVRHNNEEVFTYLVLASGAIPRDFIVLFRSVVLAAKKNNQDKIRKENVYEVVKNLRTDKDNNIENDASLSEEVIDVLRREVENEFAEKYKTNVFLIPVTEASDPHIEMILRNLENLRYIYLIKDNITSEKTKQVCKAYMIDMSFCVAGSRKKKNFEIRRYWEKTEKSSVLRQSVVWTFSKEVVDMVKSEVEKTKTRV